MKYLDEVAYSRGKNALLFFHNRALMFSDYKLSFDELVTLVSNRGYKYFLDGLGDGIIAGNISDFNIRAGMEELAINGKGKIPASNGAFTQAIANNVSSNISYVAALAYTASETSSQLVTGTMGALQTVGDSLLEIGGTLQFATKYWWVTIPLVIGGYLFFVTKVKPKIT